MCVRVNQIECVSRSFKNRPLHTCNCIFIQDKEKLAREQFRVYDALSRQISDAGVQQGQAVDLEVILTLQCADSPRSELDFVPCASLQVLERRVLDVSSLYNEYVREIVGITSFLSLYFFHCCLCRATPCGVQLCVQVWVMGVLLAYSGVRRRK